MPEPRITDPLAQPPKSLIEGVFIICPYCGQRRLPERDLRRMHRPTEYLSELNVVYECKKQRGGCGHVFSLGDQRIIAAWLSGDIVPRQWLDDKIKRVNELQAELSQLRGQDISDDTSKEETEVTAS